MPRPLLTLACLRPRAASGATWARGRPRRLLALAAVGLALALLAPPPSRTRWALGRRLSRHRAAGAGDRGARLRAHPARRVGAKRSCGDEEPRASPGVAVVPVPPTASGAPCVLDVRGAGLARAAGPDPRAARASRSAASGAASTSARATCWSSRPRSGPPRPLRSPGAFDGEAWARRDGLHALGYLQEPAARAAHAGLRRLGAPALPRLARARMGPRRAPAPRPRRPAAGPGAGHGPRRSQRHRRRHGRGLPAGGHVPRARALGRAGRPRGRVARGRRPRRAELSPLPLAVLVSGVLAGYARPRRRRRAGGAGGGDGHRDRARDGASTSTPTSPTCSGLAALVLLAWRPASVGDAGFQLSFGATLAIVLLAPGLSHGSRATGPWARGRSSPARSPPRPRCCPSSPADFHRLTPVALVLNLAAVPLSGAVLLPGGAGASAWERVAARAGDVAGDLAWMAADTLLRTCDGGGLAAADRPAGSGSGALGARAVGRRPARALPRSAGATGSLARRPSPAPVSPSGPDRGRRPSRAGRAGRGTGRRPRAPLALGPSPWWSTPASAREGFDLGERIVAPFLWSEGVTSARPPGADPRASRPRGRRALPARCLPAVRGLGGHRTRRDDRATTPSRPRCARSRVARRCVARGTRVPGTASILEVLGPVPPAVRPRRARGTTIPSCSPVTFGDVTSAPDGRHRGGGGAGPRGAASRRSLKVPHHGSRTSTTEALLVGASAAAGHRVGGLSQPLRPSACRTVLRRLAAAGVRVFRTDRDGSVTRSAPTAGASGWRLGAAGARGSECLRALGVVVRISRLRPVRGS